MSTKYMLCISYDFVDNIKIYFVWKFAHKKAFALTLLLSERCSIFNEK